MTPEETIGGAVLLLLVAVIGGLAKDVVPAVYARIVAWLKNNAAQEQKAIVEDETEERLDLETRDIANKLALKAFDIQERLQRLQAEYVEQGLLVKSQAEEIKRLTTLLENKDIAIEEYRRQVEALLQQLTNSAAEITQLRNEILILESMMDISKDK